jgi:paraquat-inducible protein B
VGVTNVGLFQKQQQPTQSPDQQVDGAVNHLFDEALREELRQRSHAYFEQVINDTAALFKQDLDATVAHINTELTQQITRQLDEQATEIARANTELRQTITGQFEEQFAQFNQTIQGSQNLALETLNRSAQALEEQHKQLSVELQKSIANQDAVMVKASETNMARITEMTDAQVAALEWLNRSVQTLQEQHEQLRAVLEQDVIKQEELIISSFQDNMAQIIEHYLLGALGDQYDLKAQLPAIIKQMDENKQAIADDMKL